MTPPRISIQLDASSLRVGVVVSRYHAWATDALLQGAVERWRRFGGRDESLLIAEAPGAWEVVAIARALSERDDLDFIVALAVVIRGETPHFDYICHGVTRGLTQITVAAGKAVGFGVLTCDSADQAKARSGGDVGNKGAEAMEAALRAALTIRAIQERHETVGEELDSA